MGRTGLLAVVIDWTTWCSNGHNLVISGWNAMIVWAVYFMATRETGVGVGIDVGRVRRGVSAGTIRGSGHGWLIGLVVVRGTV